MTEDTDLDGRKAMIGAIVLVTLTEDKLVEKWEQMLLLWHTEEKEELPEDVRLKEAMIEPSARVMMQATIKDTKKATTQVSRVAVEGPDIHIPEDPYLHFKNLKLS